LFIDVSFLFASQLQKSLPVEEYSAFNWRSIDVQLDMRFLELVVLASRIVPSS